MSDEHEARGGARAEERGTAGRGGTAERRSIPRLHVVTDDEVLMRPDWQAVATAVLGAGGERLALHVRGPGVTGRALYDRVEAVLDVARSTGGRSS